MILDEARSVLAALRPRIDDFITVRADLAELQADLAATGHSRHGGLADAKALEARLYADIEQFSDVGAEVKGFAPFRRPAPGLTRGRASAHSITAGLRGAVIEFARKSGRSLDNRWATWGGYRVRAEERALTRSPRRQRCCPDRTVVPD
jgi:hypothetical protein